MEVERGIKMDVNKIIEVEWCYDCPLYGECKAWKKLSRKNRVMLTIGNGVGDFILLGCPLTDGPDLKKGEENEDSTS